jgi:hypothetical protein
MPVDPDVRQTGVGRTKVDRSRIGFLNTANKTFEAAADRVHLDLSPWARSILLREADRALAERQG